MENFISQGKGKQGNNVVKLKVKTKNQRQYAQFVQSIQKPLVDNQIMVFARGILSNSKTNNTVQSLESSFIRDAKKQNKSNIAQKKNNNAKRSLPNIKDIMTFNLGSISSNLVSLQSPNISFNNQSSKNYLQIVSTNSPSSRNSNKKQESSQNEMMNNSFDYGTYLNQILKRDGKQIKIKKINLEQKVNERIKNQKLAPLAPGTNLVYPQNQGKMDCQPVIVKNKVVMIKNKEKVNSISQSKTRTSSVIKIGKRKKVINQDAQLEQKQVNVEEQKSDLTNSHIQQVGGTLDSTNLAQKATITYVIKHNKDPYYFINLLSQNVTPFESILNLCEEKVNPINY